MQLTIIGNVNELTAQEQKALYTDGADIYTGMYYLVADVQHFTQQGKDVIPNLPASGPTAACTCAGPCSATARSRSSTGSCARRRTSIWPRAAVGAATRSAAPSPASRRRGARAPASCAAVRRRTTPARTRFLFTCRGRFASVSRPNCCGVVAQLVERRVRNA